MNDKNKIDFTATIYLSILDTINNGYDIKKEVIDQINIGCHEWDFICDWINDNLEEESKELIEFLNLTDISRYVSVNKENLKINADETYEMEIGSAAIDVQCVFDIEKALLEYENHKDVSKSDWECDVDM